MFCTYVLHAAALDGGCTPGAVAAWLGEVRQIFIDPAPWLQAWIAHCLLYGRPLALATGLGWAWSIALAMLAFYVLLALAFPHALRRCTVTLESRPGASCLAALLVLLLSPLVFGLLFVTVVGIAVIPFLALGLFVAGLFGKLVLFGWLGRRLLRLPASESRARAAVAVLIGGAVAMALYLIPFAGFVLYKLIGILGTGAVAYTVLQALQQHAPPAAVAATAPEPASVPLSAQQLSTLPRAGFWIRMAALFIDSVLVGIVLRTLSDWALSGWMLSGSQGLALPLLAAYGAALWKLRGTTIGGIVCGLALVRVDARPIDWTTALVRALACFLSAAVAGLGFIWIAFDRDRQAWHDRIAGTLVVRVPRGHSPP